MMSGVPTDTVEATTNEDGVVVDHGTAKFRADNLDLSGKVVQQSQCGRVEISQADDDDNTEEEYDEENGPAESDLQSLQTRNTYLERQNYLMQKMIDLQKEYGRKRTRSGANQGCSLRKQAKIIPSLELLPDLALKQILKYVPAHTKYTHEENAFLNCRLVCVRWNGIIEDSPQLMKKITFPIWHPKPFLDLAIVKQGKVKSISFKCPLQLQSEHTRKFINAISNTIEKVTFAFEHTSNDDKNELFKLILKKCTNLQELIIQSSSRSQHELLSNNITDTIQIGAANNIQVLSINVDYFKEADKAGFIKLISKLPQLKELNILPSSHLSEPFVGILEPLHEYLKNYAASVELKRLSLGNSVSCSPFGSVYHHELISLLLLCGRRGISLADPPVISFNILLALSADSPDVQNNALFPANLNGELIFADGGLRNLQRLNLLNLDYLRLRFRREVMEGELSWVKHLKNVKHLRMEFENNNRKLRRLRAASTREFEDAFSASLPTLEVLEIGELFDSMRVFQWARFFPNLNCLSISDCEITPDYLISDLTGLQALSRLILCSLPNLADAAFTTEVRNSFASSNGCSELAPAICCFKSLFDLRIASCPLITDNCITNGIAKCKTLKEFGVYGGCGRITDGWCGLVSFKVNMYIDLDLM